MTRPISMRRALGALTLGAWVLLAASAASEADSIADFYRGKVVKVVIGFDPSGGYDNFARVTAAHMGKYLPGNPTLVAQNMIGAGGRLAANWIYNVAPRDGTVIGMVSEATPMDQATKQPGVQYKAENFGWIGSGALDNMVAVAWAGSGLKTLDDVKTRGGLICGGTGGKTPTMIYPRILNALLGTQIRIISGYSGSSSYALAMEQGELNCIGAISWSTAKSSMGRFLQAHQINVLVQIGLAKQPDISAYAEHDVPLIMDFANTDIDHAALELINSGFTVGRPLIAPPDVPPDRLEALRNAFASTMKDPDFLVDASKLGLNINPVSGEALQQMTLTVTSASADVLKRVDELVSSGTEEVRSAK